MSPFTVKEKGRIPSVVLTLDAPLLTSQRAGGSGLSGFFVPPLRPDVEDPLRPTPLAEVSKSESGDS